MLLQDKGVLPHMGVVLQMGTGVGHHLGMGVVHQMGTGASPQRGVVVVPLQGKVVVLHREEVVHPQWGKGTVVVEDMLPLGGAHGALVAQGVGTVHQEVGQNLSAETAQNNTVTMQLPISPHDNSKVQTKTTRLWA